MSENMERQRCFGKAEDIEKRLIMWARQLGRDKRFPWVGLGIIDDLIKAGEMLGAKPDMDYPEALRIQSGDYTMVPAKAPEPKKEYDL